MNINDWLHSTETIQRSKRSYAHFDWRTDIAQQQAYISNADRVTKHGFYPFIHYVKTSVKYNKKKGRKEKKRDICYAAHIDRCIYQYYSFILNELYNERAERDGTSSVSVAYRTNLHGSNIHFSKRAFDFMKANAPVYIMIGDFTGFFDNLDHNYLKNQWCSLLGMDRLPSDHFAIYKSITAYSSFELTDLLHLNNLDNTFSGRKKLNTMPRVLSPERFRENRSLIQKNKNPFGIPQGSPISGIMSNIYMLEVDKELHNFVYSLGGLYIRYSDDFMIILPDTPTVDSSIAFNKIKSILSLAPRLELQPEKTQYFHYADRILQNCGKLFHPEADNSNNIINFLGFSFDGRVVRIRPKTVSKYYYRLYRKARNIVKLNGVNHNGKRISGKKLYEAYSRKGARKQQGNFITYVNRAYCEYGRKEAIKQDTRKHMQKIRKALKG